MINGLEVSILGEATSLRGKPIVIYPLLHEIEALMVVGVSVQESATYIRGKLLSIYLFIDIFHAAKKEPTFTEFYTLLLIYIIYTCSWQHT